MNKLIHLNNNYIRNILTISIVLIALTGTIKSEENDKPSDSLELNLLLNNDDQYKPSDSLEFKLYFNDKEDKKKSSYFQGGILGLISMGSEDIKNGYGASLLLAYDRFHPVVIRVIPQVYWTEFERVFPEDNIASISVDLDLLINPLKDNIKPYLGVGLSYYKNYWPTDEPAKKYEIGPYDEYTQTLEYNYGSGSAHHFRTGVQIITDINLSFILDLKFTNINTEIPIIFHHINGETSRRLTTYKLNPISIYLGIITRIKI